jgi:LYR motif-containing protein 4
MSVAKGDVLKLYRALLRHSRRFSDYNFREYALRRTREDFRLAM